MKSMRHLIMLLLIVATGAGIAFSRAHSEQENHLMTTIPTDKPKFVFAGGCFWCTESEFRRIEGVVYTRVGYTGGAEPNPTYKDVSAHKTGHAEANEVYYDPAIVTYEQLVDYFLTRAHDPTQLDRQGPDIGHQYRSAIFYGNDEEKKIAEKVIDRVNKSGAWKAPIVTTLEPLGTFWPAEDYHQQYYEKYEEKNGVPHINEMLKGRSSTKGTTKLND